MIGFLKGKVISKSTESLSLVLLTEGTGTGYEITAPRPVWEHLLEGTDADLWIHTHVREDVLHLYGFATETDKKIFRILLSATGVGPKVALSLIGELGVKAIVDAIGRKQSDELAEAPGVGKKLAQKIVLELGSKIEKLEWLQTVKTLNAAVRSNPHSLESTEERLRDELISALENLSFAPNAVRTAVERVFSQTGTALSFEFAFKQCLQELSGRVASRVETLSAGGLNG